MDLLKVERGLMAPTMALKEVKHSKAFSMAQV